MNDERPDDVQPHAIYDANSGGDERRMDGSDERMNLKAQTIIWAFGMFFFFILHVLFTRKLLFYIVDSTPPQ
jgi:hypothetical protein